MGELLGINLGQYAMAETGKRKLPPEAALAMNKLIKVVQQLQAKPADIPKGKKAVAKSSVTSHSGGVRSLWCLIAPGTGAKKNDNGISTFRCMPYHHLFYLLKTI